MPAPVHPWARAAYGRLVAVPTLLCVGAFSLSRSKLEWYVYPVFPLVALAVARLLAAADRLSVRAARPVPDAAAPPAAEARRAA